MCEILVKAIDHVHPDPVKDRRGAYKRGDPVLVMPDGHEWGNEERLPRFIVLKIPGLSVEEGNKYTEPEFMDTIINPEVGDIDLIVTEKRMVTRRLWNIHLDDLPPGIKIALEVGGMAKVPFSVIRGYVFNKATGGHK